MSQQEEKERTPVQDFSIEGDDIFGGLEPMTLKDYAYNESALRHLLNDHRMQRRENKEYRKRISVLERENSGYALQPLILTVIALVNIIGGILIGLGTNYATSEVPPSGSTIILVVGAILVFLASIFPPLLPVFIKWRTRSKSNANKE